MFFGKKEKRVRLLDKKNIVLNCKPDTKDNVIRKIGQMLVDSGYVVPAYIDGMLEREKTFATYMGNSIALPHGIESAKREIIDSGIAIMIFPQGTDWDGEIAKIVIGIAGKGEEHVDILGNIACKLGEEEAVEALMSMNKDEIYDFITKKEVKV